MGLVLYGEPNNFFSTSTMGITCKLFLHSVLIRGIPYWLGPPVISALFTSPVIASKSAAHLHLSRQQPRLRKLTIKVKLHTTVTYKVFNVAHIKQQQSVTRNLLFAGFWG